jgi:AAA domain
MDDDPIEKLRAHRAGGNTHDPNAILKSARASTFEISAIEWLWQDRFAIGKLGLIVGLPDEGKGQFLADMAARVTKGSEWPCQEGRAPQGNVILFTAEDGINDTVAPRLLAAGADLSRVEIVKTVGGAHDRADRMFSLVSDLGLLRQKISDVGDVGLVQIDPISAYLGVGKIDSFRGTDVRAVLSPLVDLAEEMKVAIIGVMHFNKKMDVTNALLRISDSLAFGAAARHVYAIIDDEENQRKLLVGARTTWRVRHSRRWPLGSTLARSGATPRPGHRSGPRTSCGIRTTSISARPRPCVLLPSQSHQPPGMAPRSSWKTCWLMALCLSAT